MKVLKINLIVALNVAIREEQKYEKEYLHYTSNSALVQGWIALRDALLRNERVEIVNNSISPFESPFPLLDCFLCQNGFIKLNPVGEFFICDSCLKRFVLLAKSWIIQDVFKNSLIWKDLK